MNSKKIFKRGVAVVIICLFLGTSIISSAENTKTEKNAVMYAKEAPNEGSPLPFLNGNKGNNDWYISQVGVTFQYDPSNVAEIYYRIGGEWIKYTGQFIVSEDGSHLIPWYWIDKNGTRWNEPAIEFKIDRTLPNVELSKQTMTQNRVKFIAAANDATSGLEKVEFYLDDVIQTTVTAAPYEWIWQGTEKHMVKAIAYDSAGNLKESNTIGTPRSVFLHNGILVSRFIQRIANFLLKNLAIT